MSPIVREVTIGPCRLIQGDCVEVLPLIGRVDIVLTDPPFDAITHNGARGANDRIGLVSFESWSSDQFLVFCKSALCVSRRWVVAFCDWRHLLSIDGLPEFVRAGVWTKNDPAPQFSGDRPASGWESIAILHPIGKKRWNGGGRPAVWRTNIVKTNTIQPTQKPVSLIRQLLMDFSEQHETILDPCMGSGTTAIACIQEFRGFIGCEIDAGRFDSAVKRIQQAWDLKCSELPFEVIEQPKQAKLFEVEGVK